MSRARLTPHGVPEQEDRSGQQQHRSGQYPDLQHRVAELPRTDQILGLGADHDQPPNRCDYPNDQKRLGDEHFLVDHGPHRVNQLGDDEDEQQTVEKLEYQIGQRSAIEQPHGEVINHEAEKHHACNRQCSGDGDVEDILHVAEGALGPISDPSVSVLVHGRNLYVSRRRRLANQGGRLRLSRSNPLHKMDRTLGDGLERVLRRHHRRRLAKIGWDGAFEPDQGPWAVGHTPARKGNALQVHIDGEETFKAIIEAVLSARSFVHIAGWHMEHDFLLSEDPRLTLEDLIVEAGSRVEVRILLWGGAPLPPPFRPRRGEAKALAARFSRHAGMQLAIDSKERLLHCHHEKIMVIDGDLAFVGGLDFTTLGASRLDGSHHSPRQPMGWHDAAFKIRGPLVADVAQHFAIRWRDVTGNSLDETPPPPDEGQVEAQLVRTVPEKIYESLPAGDFSLLASYVRALRDAQRLIYIENQFLWSSEIVKILADKLADPPSDEFRVLVLLPSKPSTGNDDTLGQLAVLAEADGDGERFLACTLYGRDGNESCPVYIHAKIGIVDDGWLTIGSGNLNNHSLFNDSEVNVVTCDPELASDTRLRLWAEHLELPREQVDGDPTEVIDRLWQPIALDQLERQEAGKPMTHRVVRLPQVSKRSKRLLGPLQTFLVDG